MISARELRRKTEENRRAHYEQLRQKLLGFLEGTEVKFKQDSARGYYHSVVHLPQIVVELPFEDRKIIIDNFYTSLGYEVTWNSKLTTFSVSW